MTTRSPYTVTAGHRCKVCGTVERVSKRAQEPVDDRPAVLSAAAADLLTEAVAAHVLFGCEPDCGEAMLVHRIATRVSESVASVYQSVSEGAAAPGSRDLPDGQELDRSQPSETDHCDCGWVGKDIAKHRARSAAHAGTIGPTGESGD